MGWQMLTVEFRPACGEAASTRWRWSGQARHHTWAETAQALAEVLGLDEVVLTEEPDGSRAVHTKSCLLLGHLVPSYPRS